MRNTNLIWYLFFFFFFKSISICHLRRFQPAVVFILCNLDCFSVLTQTPEALLTQNEGRGSYADMDQWTQQLKALTTAQLEIMARSLKICVPHGQPSTHRQITHLTTLLTSQLLQLIPRQNTDNTAAIYHMDTKVIINIIRTVSTQPSLSKHGTVMSQLALVLHRQSTHISQHGYTVRVLISCQSTPI